MIYFIVPVYNEALNLSELAGDLISSLPYEEKFYLFIDDCSSDGSVALIKNLFKNHAVSVLEKEKNKGPGDSFNCGFEWVLEHSKNSEDLVVTIEADNTSDINLLPKMIVIARAGFDLTMASVYAQGGGFDRTSFLRKLFSFVANMIFRFLFDIKVLTLSSFYRVYRIELLRNIKLHNRQIIAESGFISMLEILLKAVQQQARIIEVPMFLRSMKRKGASKMKVVRTMLSYFKFFLRYYFNNASIQERSRP